MKEIAINKRSAGDEDTPGGHGNPLSGFLYSVILFCLTSPVRTTHYTGHTELVRFWDQERQI